MTLYQCPDCERIHDEPYAAAFSLLARCVDCGLEATHREMLDGTYALAA